RLGTAPQHTGRTGAGLITGDRTRSQSDETIACEKGGIGSVGRPNVHGHRARALRDLTGSAILPVLAFLGDAFDRDHALALRGREHDHTLRRAAGYADAVDRAADELAAIGDEHDLVAFLDR